MQGLYHQQQQHLANLLSAALPKDDSSSPSSATEENESSRLAALNSLHQALLCPSNSFLVTHTAQFLAQGFSQLLSDKSFAVRQSAAKAFGALCSVMSSISEGSNGRQNHAVLSNLVDGFFSWALPSLRHVSAGDKTAELALDGLCEFLNVGDPGAVENYASSILKASQELLEDERTSWDLFHQLLGILTLLSQKFSRCFQPHFVDTVDLLLGWALVPNLAESERCAIIDSFLQFKKHWVSNMPFSLRLLLKFLDDMDVLLQDASPGTPQQFQRLLALLSCFLTVLQSLASGLLEMNTLEQISEPLSQTVPKLLGCLSMIGKKFGWAKWIGDSWRCFTLLAESLREGFCFFYPLIVDVLFQSLGMDDTLQLAGAGKINSFQVHGVLKTNLQLLSLQGLSLLTPSLRKILQFNMPISQLRLHPNHLVTGCSAATYIFLLQHGNNEVVEQAVTSITEEITLLMGMLGKFLGHNSTADDIGDSATFSKPELFTLIKFDLMALLSCVSLSGNHSLIDQPDIAALHLKRSENLVALIFDKLNPFDSPVEGCVELQVIIIRTLGQLSRIEFLSKCSLRKHPDQKPSVNITSEELTAKKNFRDEDSYMIIEHLSKFSICLIKSLGMPSPGAVKAEALEWIQSLCEDVIYLYKISDEITNPCSCNVRGHFGGAGNLICSVLDVSFDREPKLRSHVAKVLELLLEARLVHPCIFYLITEVALEKLGDPEMDIKNAFARLLAIVFPMTMYQQGLLDSGVVNACRSGFIFLVNRSHMHWKQVFALKQLPQQLQSQQLVSILSYISHRWKVPLSSWIQRLIQRCRRSTDFALGEVKETWNISAKSSWLTVKMEDDFLYKISSVNNLAGVWWAIHEAARYCVATRLRTNLGGPTQTFAALERMLLDTAHLLQLEADQKDSNLNIVGSSSAHLLPMRLLLDFVEALKKNTYNAYAGSAVLPPANQQSSLFFHANKKVCEEWFSRICEPMMNAGLTLQCHDAVIHYCTLRLQELKNLMGSSLKDKSRTPVAENLHNIRGKFSEDILRVSRHMALTLCKNHDPEALIGLQKWVSKTFSSLFVDENQFTQNWLLGSLSWITGLVHQACGQYEKAAAHFTHLLQTEDSLISMDSDCVQFIIARVIECYTAVSDWKSLESWLLELQTLRAKHAGKRYSGALTTAGIEVNAIQALARFDESDFQAAWTYLDLTPKSSGELTLDPKLALQRSELMLLRAMLFQGEGKVDKVHHEIRKAKLMMEEILSVLPLDGLTEAAACATQLHCIFAFEVGLNFRCSEDEHKPKHLMLHSHIQAVRSPIDKIHQDCGLWLKVHRVYQNILPDSLVSVKLSKNILTLARKQGNLGLANRLNDYLRDHVLTRLEGSFHDFLLSKLQYEDILLMHAENQIEEATAKLFMYVYPCIVSSDSIVSSADESVLKMKACLKLSKWLKQEHFSSMNLENIVLKMLADLHLSDDASHSGSRMSFIDENISAKHSSGLIIEEIVGTVTKLSTRLCPTMGKSWISYASWCYSQARGSLSSSHDNVLRSCTLSSILVPEILPEKYKLTEDEALKVESVVLLLLQKQREVSGLSGDGEGQGLRIECAEHLSNVNVLQAMVQQVVNIIEATAAASGGENSISEFLSAALNSQLQKYFYSTIGLNGKELSSSMDDLVAILWSLRKRRVSLFGQAAHGFIRYLSYSSSNICNGPLVGSDYDPSKQKCASNSLRAILYVLHILVNFGVELKDTIEPALSTIPLLPWQEITPQLFSRLTSHPEQGVRKQLVGILIMLAKLSPWSIVYATLVDINACEAKPFEELQHILGCLSKLYPRLIHDVQLMINELENVTVLWEELWLSTLQDLHADVMSRINVLKEEATRVAENATLSHAEKTKINAAKYSAMMAPVVVSLERRLASTSRKPETCHEIWFSKEYMGQLKSAILTFKAPPETIAELGNVWQPFNNIASSLACCQRKSSISLKEVAPQLALLSSSDVPMPGLEKQITLSESDGDLQNSALQGIVRITSFSEQLSILSTKTRPKKLVILGSDGNKYTYLLKGREDLRLDSRIMQLLQAINGFLRSSFQTHGQFLSIRYYSVTPISGRAGLIQWVDNLTSVYNVFKSWQNHAQLAQLSSLGSSNSKNTVPPPVPRPSDMFYGKIIPALKEKGIRRVISRRDWPHDVKRKVLLELMKESPRQLLHQEIWCASEGFKAFSSKLKRFSGSVASMSMVGHILGLGDRHLDNILLDFSSGDIVHIDYNVCFDKGQRLKIPEIVPFRLTQTIEAALGLTGIEGTFRANCEAVIGVLRKNKDIILMLLEVFLWDPLVEWTRGDLHDDATIGGEERRGMELAVSLSLFASRVQELRVPLQEHHDLLLANLPAVASALEKFAEVLNQYETVSTRFFHVDKERSNLILQESSAKSIVAEASSNSEKTRASYELQAREFAQTKAMVAEIAQGATAWMEQHGRILDALRNSSIPEIKAFTKLKNMVDSLSLTSAVLMAGVPLTVVPEPTLMQCRDIDREVSQFITDLDQCLSCAVGAIKEYSISLQRILPLNYHTTSPVNGWAQVLKQSVSTISPDVLSIPKRQAAELIAKAHEDGHESIMRNHNDLCLKVEQYAMERERIEEECAELMNTIGLDTESKAKNKLVSALVRYFQFSGGSRKGEGASSMRLSLSKFDGPKDAQFLVELEEKKEKIFLIYNLAIASMYNEVKNRALDILSNSDEEKHANSNLQSDFGTIFCNFEEQVEKCVLLEDIVNEICQIIGKDSAAAVLVPSESNCLSNIKSGLHYCKSLVGQLNESISPDIITSVVSFNSEVMDAFGCLSQIRGSIDTTLEQLIDVELERASLLELEQNYFVKVSFITEQQLALEEAAVKGRDHLSWEEAEELASQEEACRVQLDQLHLSWNQKDLRKTSLIKREAGIKNALISAERHFESFTNHEQEREPNLVKRKVLLSTLVKPFSELELIDKQLPSIYSSTSPHTFGISNFAEVMCSEYPTSGFIWKFSTLLNRHCFFIWKVGVLDSFLDSCIHDAVSFVDQNLGFDQLLNVVKKKLESHLQQHIDLYLKERIGPAFLAWLDKRNEHLMQLTETTKGSILEQVDRDGGAVKHVRNMLEECCNAYETVRAARSAASAMKKQANELEESLCKTSLEIVQMEWIYDAALSPSHNHRLIFHKFLSCNDDLYPIILNLSRPKILEGLQSAVSKIASSVEHMQAYERTGVTAEGQLERAMGWAFGGPSLSATGNPANRNSGIPPEFHEHLAMRRELLRDAQENASDVMKICMSLLEFESSRDGVFRIPGETSQVRVSGDGISWQQAFLNALTRLDVTYNSFMRSEQEWKLAHSSLEAASSALFSATKELSIVSMKAKSASGNLQSTLLAMRDCAYEASVALSAFSRVTKVHTALTSDSGSMLEEVLAITEGLHDVHNLGKEAATAHHNLVEVLSKASSILHPLDSVLSRDIAAMNDAMARESETKLELSPIHGQAIYQSYSSRIREACQVFQPLVPSLTFSVEGLHSMLTRLARTASFHAGNLHKALEGLGESQEATSPEINLLRPDLTADDIDFDNKLDEFSRSNGRYSEDFSYLTAPSSQDKGWLSPPDTIDSSSESSITSTESSLPDNLPGAMEQISQRPDVGGKPSTVWYSEPVGEAGSQESKHPEDSNLESSLLSPSFNVSSSLSPSLAAGVENMHSFDKEASSIMLRFDDEASSSNIIGVKDGNQESHGPTMDSGKRAGQGKNAYALSVLRRVELKLDGCDIDKRECGIAEQVDCLLKQAMSIDNLCNMYEGWTPWI